MSMFMMILLAAQPEQAPPVRVVLVQAPPVQDCYEQMAKTCAAEKKPLVVFVGVPSRKIAGLDVCVGAFPEKGIVIGIPANGWLDRYDLPADTSDEAIRAFVFSKITQRVQNTDNNISRNISVLKAFERKEARQEAPPRPFRVQATRSSRSSGSC